MKEYYKLAKPGIIYGNIFTTVAAYIFAVGTYRHDLVSGQYSLIAFVFFATVIGLSLVIGSACVFNNYLDRDIDAKMSRTSTRALVTGRISVRNALVYGSVLGVFGLLILYLCVNTLSAILALIGFLSYVVVYSYAKKKTYWGAAIGTIPGAVPIVVGYTAATNQLDLTALILFLVLVFWQMPHFYAIAIRRFDEYTKAHIPVFPAKKGVHATKVHILFYILAYLAATVALWSYGFANYYYLASVLVFGLLWLYRAVQGFKSKTPEADMVWAKKLFFFSLIVLVSFCVTIAVTPW